MSRKKPLKVSVARNKDELRKAMRGYQPKVTKLHSAISGQTPTDQQCQTTAFEKITAIREIIKRFEQKLIDLGIEKLYLWVGENNPTNNLPYHNVRHISYMTWLTYGFLIAATIKVTDHEFKHALVAAMFHDFNHSGGTQLDQFNIERAIDGYHLGKEALGITDLDDALVERYISVTEFPFCRTPVNYVEGALRDADALYPLSSGDPDIILTGLRTEMEIKLNRKVPLQEMVEGQIAWYDNLETFTEVGKITLEINRAQYYKDLKTHAEIL